jgi:magnesium chelatase family protein
LGSPKIRVAEHLGQVLDFLRGAGPLAEPEPPPEPKGKAQEAELDRVLGNALAKRALQVALAGRHHLLLVGSPGVGKTLLAQSASSLLPPLSSESWLEVLKNFVHARDQVPPWRRAPFRSPHHTISGAALLGGGSGVVLPGEVTLSHGGVLFLDELVEFRKEAIEGLREPLQNGKIHLHRIGTAVTLPARFTLIGAMNPCPCGHSLGARGRCRCSPERLLSYRRKLSGPMLDRFDLCVVLSDVAKSRERGGLAHEEIASSVLEAHLLQESRYKAEGRSARNGDTESDLRSGPFELAGAAKDWFEGLLGADGVSFRSAFRSLRVARTLADLAGSPAIEVAHLQEAWSLRCPNSGGSLFGH